MNHLAQRGELTVCVTTVSMLIRQAFFSLSDISPCSVGSTILPLSWVRSPEVTVDFLGSLELSLLLVIFSSLVDTLLHRSQLEGSFYECLWRRGKGFWHINISTTYHRGLELGHCIYYFVSHENPLRWKEINTTNTSPPPPTPPPDFKYNPGGALPKNRLKLHDTSCEDRVKKIFRKKLETINHLKELKKPSF